MSKKINNSSSIFLKAGTLVKHADGVIEQWVQHILKEVEQVYEYTESDKR